MNIYHRNTNSKFILLWTFSMVLIIGAIIFAIRGELLVVLLTLVVIIIIGSIKIDGLSITDGTIFIRRYKTFGFGKEEVKISKERFNELEFWEHGNLNNTNSTDSWLDLLFIPALFVGGKKGMTFKTVSPNSRVKSLRLFLSDIEYLKIKELMR